ncbi:efflux RND transporter periplasmic adaptor subunit [Sphingomonas sp. PB2P12]|uniref:efflux RND transporter periplasmic adaptor subunit n=1 Tax=Sphingomonas sandaracina TaxID=3096157 RepID=UPI002FC860F3
MPKISTAPTGLPTTLPTMLPIGLIAAGLTLLACSGCSSEPVASPRSDATLVDVVTIHHAGGQTSTFDGVLRPRREIALGFKTGGRVLALSVQVGDHVRAGQVLARLSRDGAVADSGQARAELAAATAEATRAGDAARRASGLDGIGALSTAEVRDRALTASAAAAKRDAARAAFERSRATLADAVLVAPKDGVVTERAVESGTVVDAGSVVVRLAAGGPEIEVRLPERVRLTSGTMAHASFWSAPDTIAEARLRLVGPAADGALRLRTARFSVLGDVSQIPYNSSATVSLRMPDPRATIRVPLTAIGAQGSQPHVWSLSNVGDRVHRQPVHLVELRGEDAIVSGLPDGQRIVASGGDTLSEGQRVVMAGLVAGGN